MKWHLPATALSTILVLASGCLARADTRPQLSRPTADAPPAEPLRDAARSLQQARHALSDAGEGARQDAVGQARRAVRRALDRLDADRAGLQGRSDYADTRRKLQEAATALDGDRPGHATAMRELRQAAAALASFAGLGGGFDRGGQSADDPSSAAILNLPGRTLIGTNGREAGEVRNLLVDASGRVRAAVLEWGGFFGLGERTAIVPIDRIQFVPGESGQARLTLTREQLENLPSFDRNKLGEIARSQGWGDDLQLLR